MADARRKTSPKTQQADLGGGCFWNIEEVFRTLDGVVKTEVGYEGGHVDHPTYEQVVTHTTGHAETVQITFDPNTISFQAILKVFFEHINPTELNRQGPDAGDNYRSVIFYHDAEQQRVAQEFIADLQAKYHDPIVTQVVPASTFWGGEDYHQQYLHKRDLGICY